VVISLLADDSRRLVTIWLFAKKISSKLSQCDCQFCRIEAVKRSRRIACYTYDWICVMPSGFVLIDRTAVFFK